MCTKSSTSIIWWCADRQISNCKYTNATRTKSYAAPWSKIHQHSSVTKISLSCLKFTSWDKLPFDQTLPLEIGESHAPNSASAPNGASEQPSRYMPMFNQSPTSRPLIAQTEFEQRGFTRFTLILYYANNPSRFSISSAVQGLSGIRQRTD
jgi:hypothetical protein